MGQEATLRSSNRSGANVAWFTQMRLRAPQPACLKTDLQRCQWNDPHGLRASPLRLDAQQDVLDERLKVRVLRDGAPREPGEKIRVFLFQQATIVTLLIGAQLIKAIIHEVHQQQVEFQQPSPAPPAQLVLVHIRHGAHLQPTRASLPSGDHR